jgi:aldehyde:ferredoxin oxidoreductase
MRLFNLREGLSSKDDKLPERFYQSTRDGALKDYTAEKSLYDGAIKYYLILKK